MIWELPIKPSGCGRSNATGSCRRLGDGEKVTELIEAFAITVIAVSIIYRACELAVEAHQELDEERARKREEEEGGET